MNIAMEQTEVHTFCQADCALARARAAVFARAHTHTLAPSHPHPQQEYADGQLKNKYGDAFIRGNNVLYISNAEGKK